ncbi:MAG TPA: HDOD domain-containing protein [Phycisphaerae bacterium]|nr:HDOD domain-containing protein [Phycisphaerales bacterium]HRX86876.1 HDOD domain-containing protein [Phycisphaerae bacterium]
MKSALAAVGEIATLPEVTVKIIEVVEDPKGTARDLHEVIKKDPALSAKVLKVVNSAFYGLPGQVASVDRAIVLLGLSAVKNIAIAASISRLFNSAHKSDLFDARELWRHSVAVGVAAKKISQAAGDLAGHEEMFLAGLIHDLGLLIERQAFPDKLNEVVRAKLDTQENFLEIEQRIIGATHQDFGDALTTRWKFPRHLRAAVGFHHNPDDLAAELKRIGMIVHCADVLCCQEGHGFSLTADDAEFTEELLNGVGITVEKLVEVRDNMLPELEEASAMLSPQAD